MSAGAEVEHDARTDEAYEGFTCVRLLAGPLTAATAPALRAEVRAAIELGRTALLLDLDAVTGVDAGGLGAPRPAPAARGAGGHRAGPHGPAGGSRCGDRRRRRRRGRPPRSPSAPRGAHRRHTGAARQPDRVPGAQGNGDARRLRALDRSRNVIAVEPKGPDAPPPAAPRPPESGVVISRGTRVHLRTLVPRDLDLLAAWVDDPFLERMVGSEFLNSYKHVWDKSPAFYEAVL